MATPPFNVWPRMICKIDERSLHTLIFCNMNCGNPIMSDISAIYSESTKNIVFNSWVEHGGELPTFDSCVPNIPSIVQKITEKYRQRYLRRVGRRYENFDIKDSIHSILHSIKHRVVLETSTKEISCNPVVVVTRPLYDFATWYTYAWVDEIVKQACKRGFMVLDLGIQHANRKNLEQALSELEPVLYSHYGHGNETSIIGHLGEKIIDEGNCEILTDRMAYVMACRTAVQLGKLSINRGCVGYMGFNKNFLFVTQWNVMEKELAQLYQRLKEQGYINWKDIREIKDATRKLIVRCLEHNKKSLSAIGDEVARIRDIS